MDLSLDALLQLFESRGSAWYGHEAVSQREHALQCAELAESAGAGSELIAACLLHDVGHMLADRENDRRGDEEDDIHQYAAIPQLRKLFPDAVLEPIRLHVDAKRYLCAVDSRYWATLSAASKQSLELQGGIFSPQDADNFMRNLYAGDAVLLRQWDDSAKVPGKTTKELEHYVRVLQHCAL